MAQGQDSKQTSDDVICHLGALPPELFDRILFELDSVRDLANFVATVRFVYRRFEAQKTAVLSGVLQNELGPVMIDAKFLSMFPYSDPKDWERYYDRMHDMAAVYREMLQGVRGDGVPSLGKLTDLCRTLHKINFIADTFLAAQLRSFLMPGEGASAPVIRPDDPVTAPLTRTERLRVVRAFYRRQIVSNAWAPTRRGPYWGAEDSAAMSNTSTHQGKRLGLLAAFEPWELQQIEHANLFITRVCIALVHREGDGPEESMQLERFGDLYAHLDALVRYLRANPELAEVALSDVSSRTEPSYSEVPYRRFVDRYSLLPLTYPWQSDRSESLPDPGAEKRERDGDKLVHVGDNVNLVPFAWVDALDGRFTTWFGDGLGSISQNRDQGGRRTYFDRWKTAFCWRCAGSALWDRSRAEALKRIPWLETARTGWAWG
jgi:hypothetical protein